MNRNGNVVLAGDDQTEIAGMSLLERYEVFKKLATSFVRVNAAAVKQVRRSRPLRLAQVRFDRHRNNPSGQVAPELPAHTQFCRRQPNKLASTTRRVFVRRQISRELVVQCGREKRTTGGNLLQAEVRRRIEIGDEDHGAIVTPVFIEITQQRFRV